MNATSQMLALAARWEAEAAYYANHQPIRHLEIAMLREHARAVRETINHAAPEECRCSKEMRS